MDAFSSFHVCHLLLIFFLILASPCRSSSDAFLPLKLVTDCASSVPIQTILTYHHGSLLAGPKTINLYLIWYGDFSASQKSIVKDFLSSLSPPAPAKSVSSWWKTTTRYVDSSHSAVSNSLRVQAEFSNAYSLRKRLHRSDIATIVKQSLATPSQGDPKGIYLVLTSDDVYVDGFCMNSCGFHDHLSASPATKGEALVYGWIGNAAKQCPGQCAWPFAAPQFGPPTVLTAPNGDVGMDGMIINIATILAGSVTNPLNDGYFQGDARAPLEAVSACTGIFGSGAYPGYPGALLVDKVSGASYNARGANNRFFLLPAMWDPSIQACSPFS